MDYRLYFFDGDGKHIQSVLPLRAADDTAAIREALKEADPGLARIELWELGRLVVSWAFGRPEPAQGSDRKSRA